MSVNFNSNNFFYNTDVNESSEISTSGDMSVETDVNIWDSHSSNNSSSGIDDISDDDYELIKKELERKIQEQKQELEDAKETRGWLTSGWNALCGVFGGGDKDKENTIKKNEELLASLENNPEKLLEVYEAVMGSALTNEKIGSLHNSNVMASSLSAEEEQIVIQALEEQLETLENDFKTAKNSNGWISGAWDSFKNWTGIGASSNKTSAQIENLKEQIQLLKNGEADLATTYKNITGNDFTIDEVNSLLNGEISLGDISKAGESLNDYTEGQKMVVDTVADITSGIVSVVVVTACSAAGICAAPFTAGASLGMVAAGVGIAAGVGSAVKVAMKSSDCIGNEKEYSLTDAAYDTLTGAANGAMGVFSNGVGATVGKGIMKQAGMEALETTAKRTFTQSAIKVGARATDMALDGALSGATDALTRDVGENIFYGANHSLQEILTDTAIGFGGGAVASPIIGGGMIGARKAGSIIGSELSESAVGKATRELTNELSDTVLGSTAKEAKEYLGQKFYKFAGDLADTKATNLLNLYGKVQIGEELVDADFVAKLIDGVDINNQEALLNNFIKLRNAGMPLGDDIVALSNMDLDDATIKAIQDDISNGTFDVNNVLNAGVSKVKIGTPLSKSGVYEFNPKESFVIDFGENRSIRFDNVELQNKLANLADGESITIGSIGSDCDIWTGVSKNVDGERYVTIQKVGDSYTIQDCSAGEISIKNLDINARTSTATSAEDLYVKIRNQLDITSADDVDAMVQRVMKDYPDADENEILYVMQTLTQFGSYEQLAKATKELSSLGCTNFYKTGDSLTLNNALFYISAAGKKHNFAAQGFGASYGKKAIVLDESGISYLKSLSSTELDALIARDDIVFVEFKGWNEGVNAYNIGSSQDLLGSTQSILEQARKIKTEGMSWTEAVDQVINENQTARLGDLAPKLDGKIKTIEMNEVADSSTVARQLQPVGIDSAAKVSEMVDHIIDEVADGYDPAKKAEFRQLLIQYFDNQMDIYSPTRLNKKLKNIYTNIEAEVLKSGKTMDDVYYLIPTKGKSFDQVGIMYAQANGIDTSRFIYENGSNPGVIPDGATVVVLDDVVGSGMTMISQEFNYTGFQQNYPNNQVIFAPITCAKKGYDYISDEITQTGRNDILLYDRSDAIDSLTNGDFYKSLSPIEQTNLLNILNSYSAGWSSSGVGQAYLSTVFPYMGPDNDSAISGFLTKYFVLNESALKQRNPKLVHKPTLH